MNKVYMVQFEDYESSHVVGIFKNKKIADSYAAQLNVTSGMYDDYHVYEEEVLEDVPVVEKSEYLKVEINYYYDDDDLSVYISNSDTVNDAKEKHYKELYNIEMTYYITRNKEITKEKIHKQAKKIVLKKMKELGIE